MTREDLSEGTSPHARTREYDINYTNWWKAYAATIYVFLAVVYAAADFYVVKSVSLTSFPLVLVHVIVSLAISAFCGLFAEYSRQRLKMEMQENV